MKDPVCQMIVDENSPHLHIHDKQYYFCSEGCLKKFKENNQFYLQKYIYDLIIIGGGPAGLTAGVYASIQKIDTLLLAQNFGGQAVDSSHIKNYMGFDFITGTELKEKFENQLLQSHYFHTTAWYNLLFGGLSVIATVVSGLIAEAGAPHTDTGHELLATHKTIGFIVLGIILFLAIWRIVLKSKLPVKGLAIYLIVSVLGVGLMFVGGYYGGEMVYTHGFGVKAATQTTEHIHGEGETHEHSKTVLDEHHQNMPDSTKMEQGEVHEHKDGAKHVH